MQVFCKKLLKKMGHYLFVRSNQLEKKANYLVQSLSARYNAGQSIESAQSGIW